MQNHLLIKQHCYVEWINIGSPNGGLMKRFLIKTPQMTERLSWYSDTQSNGTWSIVPLAILIFNVS